ncbi:MAG: tetratricopeptide repeat protein [Acidobacteriota bacterium]
MIPDIQRIGPYRIDEEIARGGMGIVYRGRHAETGLEAAVKTVRVAESWLVGGIRREIHALARLRHPGVVRVIEQGIDDGMPWYAMELVEGRTMRDVARTLRGLAPSWDATIGATQERPGTPTQTLTGGVASVPDQGIPIDAARLAEALALVRRLCVPLSYIHGEGLVHRDLKPDNVLVRLDGSPVLVDFGLAHARDPELFRESLDPPTDALGTLAYLAPEQAEHATVDARADLYALGCILYEMLTGRPPFLGASVRDLVHQHRARPPIPPSALVPALPPISTVSCCGSSRRSRASVQDMLVARALRALGAGDGAADGDQGRAYLIVRGFAGRDDVLAELAASLPRRGDEPGDAIVLVRERAASARRGDLRARGRGEASARARGRLRSLPARRRRRAGSRGSWPRSRSVAANGATTTAHPESARKVLAAASEEIARLPPVREEPEPGELAAPAARLRFARALGDALGALAAAEPLFVAIDDLQWADDLTLDFLSWLAASDLRLSACIVGSFRAEETTGALRALLDPGRVKVVDLGRLDDRAVGSMVADMLGVSSAPAVLATFVARASEGNPFFVAEYLKTAVAEGLLYRDDEGRWTLSGGTDPESLALPESLRDLVRRRLAGVSPPAREVLFTLAAIGRECEHDVLSRATALAEGELMEGISELVARQIVEESPARLRFVHDKIVEVAQGDVPASSMADRHRRIAEALEATEARSEERLAALGLHWERAGERERAQAHYAGAARLAAARYAPRDAEAHYEAAIALGGSPSADRIQLRLDLASDVLGPEGRLAEARVHVAAALEASRTLGDPDVEFKSRLQLAFLCVRQADLDEARAMVPRLVEILPTGPSLRSTSAAGVALILQFLGRIAESLCYYEEALAIARDLGADDKLGYNLGNYGVCLQWARRFREARAAYEESLAIARRIGERRLELRNVINLATLERREGRIERAIELSETALRIVREIGDRYDEGSVLQNMGENLLTFGRLADAERIYALGLAISRETRHRRVEASVLQGLAVAALEKGDLDGALALCRQGAAAQRAAGLPRSAGLAIAEEIEIHAARGDLNEALRCAEEASRIAAEVSEAEPAAVANLFVSAALRAASRLPEARAALERATPWIESEGDHLALTRLVLERTLLARALREDDAPFVARARELAAVMGAADGWLARAVRSL